MKIDFARLDRAFNPKCVAVIGDNGRLRWLRNQSTFQGKLYSVQISPEQIKAIEALGIKNYTSLLDVPEEVDLAIVAVPRKVTPQILDDCIKKGIAAAHLFTAGFKETDTEEGKRLQETLVARAKEANFYLIGPNCMGIFNPAIGLRQNDVQYVGSPGAVGFISQSGAHAVNFSVEAHQEGLDINKSVSFGNGAVLDAPDYLEYFAHDDGIKVIGMYLEGVHDGKRFMSVLRETSRIKPVVIWKGGRTREGQRAIASHTGSLSIGQTIWETAVSQCGAINVYDLEELIDTLKALLYLPPIQGSRVGIAGGSGGQSVAITDAFAESGLEVPRLSHESYKELGEFFILIGSGYGNPIDIGGANRPQTKRIIGILEKDANVDNLAFVVTVRTDGRTTVQIADDAAMVIDIKRKTSKPVIAINPVYISNNPERAKEISSRLQADGVPTFNTFERGARALKNALDYYKLHR